MTEICILTSDVESGHIRHPARSLLYIYYVLMLRLWRYHSCFCPAPAQVVETTDVATQEDGTRAGGDGRSRTHHQQHDGSAVGGPDGHVRANALLLPGHAPRGQTVHGRRRPAAQEDRRHPHQHRLPGRAAHGGAGEPLQKPARVHREDSGHAMPCGDACRK